MHSLLYNVICVRFQNKPSPPNTVLHLFITLTLIIITVYAFHRFWMRSENRVSD